MRHIETIIDVWRKALQVEGRGASSGRTADRNNTQSRSQNQGQTQERRPTQKKKTIQKCTQKEVETDEEQVKQRNLRIFRQTESS